MAFLRPVPMAGPAVLDNRSSTQSIVWSADRWGDGMQWRGGRQDQVAGGLDF